MDVIVLEPPHRRRSADIGECPRCRQEGRTGRLRIVVAVDRTSPGSFGFAGCDLDRPALRPCGYTALVQNRRPPRAVPCPECEEPMRRVNRRDGGHSLVCDQDGWFLADRSWQVVRSPTCPECRKPMVHRERSDTKGRFYWACFAHRAFADSDVYGAIIQPVPKDDGEKR